MNIKTFEKEIPMVIASRGKKYYKDGRIVSLGKSESGGYKSKIKGTHSYQAAIWLEDDGQIKKALCSCPYGSFCKHLVAMCFAIRNQPGFTVNENSAEMNNKGTVTAVPAVVTASATSQKSVIKEAVKKTDSDMESDRKITKSSPQLQELIRRYDYNARELAVISNSDSGNQTPVEIVPVIYPGFRCFEVSLMIGREKKYAVNDIYDLVSNFEYNREKKYGKAFTFIHDYDKVDPKSLELLDLVNTARKAGSGYEKKKIPLEGNFIRKFSALMDGKRVIYRSRNNYDYEVTFCEKNPEISFEITENDDTSYRISCVNGDNYEVTGFHRNCCWLDCRKEAVFIADHDYEKAVYGLFIAANAREGLVVSKEDMSSFSAVVLKTVEKHCKVKGRELVADYLPPEGKAKLFLDVEEEGEISAKLEFHYDDQIYGAFGSKDGRLCDFEMEYRAEKLAESVFEQFYRGRLYVIDEDKIYEFLVSGLQILSNNMEIFASDRFSRMGVRQPVRPVVEIGKSVDLLELRISSDEYSQDELVEMLNAYRKGVKYHRLRDGSFVNLSSGFSELDSLTSSLNITDKALLKQNINVPLYRMLYLDNLAADNDEMRIQRSREFRHAVNDFRIMADDEKNLTVPDNLKKIMRSYQQYGFRWMKTVASFGFGGILADDMGLGKTIQAISLIQDAVSDENSGNPNLVVCPASLSLNWENEIRKFAPELNVTVLNGNAADRKQKMSTISESDVVVIPYSLIGRDIAELEDIQFNMQFIDEAQYIKNHNTQTAKAVKAVKSRRRFALTGTPVENSLAELWSIFDFIMPGYLYGYTHFKKNFETPISKNDNGEAVSKLQRLISPFVLRRLKKDVLKELPEKTETVLYADMTGNQRKLYTASALNARKMLKETDDSERIKILAMLTRLRQICCDPSLVFENYDDGSAKLELCMELVEECVSSGHKILLFSQFTSMLDIIADELSEREISFFTLEGSTKPAERIRLVNSFNEDDTKVFLISLKAGGTGLNLTGADIVIHYDPWWNVSAENQASDRAHRIGQKNKVQIFKLITHDTIEEKICELQKLKSELADIALSGEGNIMKMSADDILSLIE